MVAATNYIQYPVDIPHSRLRLQELYDAADVIHLHNSMHAHQWYDAGQGKPTILHHHGLHDGTMKPYEKVVDEATRDHAVQVGSTYNLTVIRPEVQWLPTPVNLAAMRELRGAGYRVHEKVRIAHAPTDRSIKGTAEFLAAFDNPALSKIAEPVLIEKLPWMECLTIKATADVLYDQSILGYGSNAVEAWALGMPVIAGVEDPTIRKAMLEKWGVLPFYEAHGDGRTLEDSLLALASDPDLFHQYREIGSKHVEQWHDERRTVHQLAGLYRKAEPTRPGGSAKRLKVPTAAERSRWERRDRNRAERRERAALR